MLLQEKGYALVGLEQTKESVSIIGFTFPRKCVLLLGNELRGMPAPLISMLDHVVEIPQVWKKENFLPFFGYFKRNIARYNSVSECACFGFHHDQSICNAATMKTRKINGSLHKKIGPITERRTFSTQDALPAFQLVRFVALPFFQLAVPCSWQRK